MVGISIASVAISVATLFSASVLADVDPIVIKGSKFFYKTNGTEFFIKGVAYQQDAGGNGTAGATSTTVADPADPLADMAGCQRDIPILQELQTNTIRVYAIDPTKDHKPCMTMLQNAGIYVVADLSAPSASINRDDPQWNGDLYARYTSVVDTLAPFSNVLGFFAGNEVSNNASNVDAIPFVKAAVRDIKAYIKQKNYRTIGVGYAADDDATIRAPLEDYLNCGDAASAIDFFGYNIYSWCGKSSFQASGYADRTTEFSNYSVPAFFAEYGCNVPEPRQFDETIALYSDQMTGVWSGGIVYQYFQSTNNYGLVQVSGGTAQKLPDFSALSSQIAKVTPSGVQMGSYTPTNTVARSCPTAQPSWQAATNLPPTPNEQLCGCMVQNLTCVAKSGISGQAVTDLFNAVCGTPGGQHVCDGIARNGTTGTFGAYGMCNTTEKLSWAFDSYYQFQAQTNSANTDACDFGGNATKVTPTAPSGQCGALVSQAGSAGTGVVTSQPSGSGSNSGGAAGAASSSGLAGVTTVPSFDLGLLKLGVYVTVAVLTGAGMILL